MPKEEQKRKNDRIGIIYSLSCPNTKVVRYIGQTRVSVNTRYNQHKYQWKRCKRLNHVNSWIKSLYKKGLFPVVEIIEDNIPLIELDEKEIQYIKIFKSIGANLTNHQAGGRAYNNGVKMSEEGKQKRLMSLESSIAWKERNKRHSEIMKSLYKEGRCKMGIYSWTEEQKKKAIAKGVITRQKKVCSITEDGKIIKVFDSVKSAAQYYSIPDSTHIVRVCKGKNKSGITYGIRFRYYKIVEIK